ELAHGALSGQSKVFGCPDEPACVRVDHLRIFDAAISPVAAVTKARGRRGGGSMRLVSPGVWELAVVAGYYPDGKPRRLHRRVQASDTTAAAGELAAFVTEIRGGPPPAN